MTRSADMSESLAQRLSQSGQVIPEEMIVLVAAVQGNDDGGGVADGVAHSVLGVFEDGGAV